MRPADRRRYADRRAVLDRIKVERGCADCGFRDHPAALEFDHVDPKAKHWVIASNWSRSWETVLAEIAKCVVRCANCHAIRTATEGHGRAGARRGDVSALTLFEVAS